MYLYSINCHYSVEWLKWSNMPSVTATVTLKLLCSHLLKTLKLLLSIDIHSQIFTQEELFSLA